MLGPEKCLYSNSLRIITKFFAVPTFLVKRMHRSFAIGTLLRKPPARTTPMDRLLISRAFLLCTHVHLVTQESQLCSCLRKCKWNATYCKHKTKRRISGIESPLHSCWDKITVKNRRGGFLGARGGVPEPLEPSPGYAPVHSSNLRCICPSLLETNLNKAKYSIYEKLSRVFSVAGSRFEEK